MAPPRAQSAPRGVASAEGCSKFKVQSSKLSVSTPRTLLVTRSSSLVTFDLDPQRPQNGRHKVIPATGERQVDHLARRQHSLYIGERGVIRVARARHLVGV